LHITWNCWLFRLPTICQTRGLTCCIKQATLTVSIILDYSESLPSRDAKDTMQYRIFLKMSFEFLSDLK
jgi:hypothetical protein